MTLAPASTVFGATILLSSMVLDAEPAELDDLYTADAIVTGRSEKTRQPGFEDCLRKVVVRVSGDPRLPSRPGFRQLLPRAGDFITDFDYRDRMSGIPVHDDQGSYDRPYDLRCSFDREKIDRLLAGLESRPWLTARPRLTIVLLVENAGRRFILASGGTENPLMLESLLAEAASLGLEIVVPDRTALADAAAKIAAGSRVLAGQLGWNDGERAWEADWSLPYQGRTVRWQARAATFDTAFRDGLGGAAQVLSGNGKPQ